MASLYYLMKLLHFKNTLSLRILYEAIHQNVFLYSTHSCVFSQSGLALNIMFIFTKHVLNW